MTSICTLALPPAPGAARVPRSGCMLQRIVPMVLGLWCASMLHAQTHDHYRIVGWQPTTSSIDKQSITGKTQHLTQGQHTVSGNEKLCLVNGNSGQTLVQVQPAEGGEARFVAIGGGQPMCRSIGESWAAAQSGEAPWYKTLFATLGAQSGGTRISASTTGVTRGNPSSDSSQPVQDACGLYPTDQGLIQLPNGPAALTLGTLLPDGTSVTLQSKARNGELPHAALVTQGRVQWPKVDFHAGEHWHLLYRPSSPSTNEASDSVDCGARIMVRPASASPLIAAQANSPRFAADNATVQVTLVAAQLEDGHLSAWHAWLLSSIAPSHPGAQDLGASLWRAWWNSGSTYGPSSSASD